MDHKKILIYRRGGLGDSLLIFPIAEIYKKLGWEVHLVGNTDAFQLALEVGFASKVFSELPNVETYDEVILISVKKFINAPNIKWIYPFPTSNEHITEYYLKKLDLRKYTFSEILPIERFTDWSKYIILHPGSGSEKKNPPLELYKNLYLLLEKQGFSPLFVIGEAELPLVEQLKTFRTYKVKNLLLFAKLLKGAKGYIGNDSGFSHLSGYLGTPTIVLFGPTNPKIWKPLGKRVKVLYKGLECSPCFPANCHQIPIKKCLLYEPHYILNSLKNLMKPASGGE